MNITKKVWIIVSKDRKLIAKGVPRDRHLVLIDDEDDSKRILTYASKKKAENAFKSSFFYQSHGLEKRYKEDELEAVEAVFSISFDN